MTGFRPGSVFISGATGGSELPLSVSERLLVLLRYRG